MPWEIADDIMPKGPIEVARKKTGEASETGHNREDVELIKVVEVAKSSWAE